MLQILYDTDSVRYRFFRTCYRIDTKNLIFVNDMLQISYEMRSRFITRFFLTEKKTNIKFEKREKDFRKLEKW